MQQLIDFLRDLILGTITKVAQWIIAVISVILETVFDIVKDLAKWIFNQILNVTDFILSLFPVPDILMNFNLQTKFDSLGGQMVGLLGYVGIPQALAMLATAFSIRLIRDLLRR